jgi:hypothetical protein
MSVFDIRIVTETPTLSLFLDADHNFDAVAPAPPQDDLPLYVPGDEHPTRTPKAVPLTGTLIDNVDVVAAYVLSNGAIAPPPPGITSVLMTLDDVSTYDGFAMNAPGGSGDLAMPISVVTFGMDNTARNNLEIHDYAARGTVVASAGIADSATMSVPMDADNNGIADGGWRAADLTSVADRAADEDADSDPAGDWTDGDGLTAIQEYRGIVVLGVLRRLNPTRKDLFLYSEHPQFIGDAVNLPLNLHLMQAGEMGLSDRVINPYYVNSGHGSDLRDVDEFQRGLHIMEGGTSTIGAMGFADPMPNIQPKVPSPPNDMLLIWIYSSTIRTYTPTNSSPTLVDSIDEPVINQTIAHEVGHGIRIPHWQKSAGPCAAPVWPNRDLTVMITCLYDPNVSSTWSAIPHTYDGDDLINLRIKK